MSDQCGRRQIPGQELSAKVAEGAKGREREERRREESGEKEQWREEGR